MPPYFIPFLLIVAFVIMPSAGFIASRLGGWSKLAKVYPDAVGYSGDEILCSGGMGVAHYGFSLLLGANYTGLSLKVTPWLRPGHEPLFVPWEDISTEEVQSLFYPRIMISFKNCPGVFLGMPKKDVLKVKAMSSSGKAFPTVQ